jgi:hypothetical protein
MGPISITTMGGVDVETGRPLVRVLVMWGDNDEERTTVVYSPEMATSLAVGIMQAATIAVSDAAYLQSLPPMPQDVKLGLLQDYQENRVNIMEKGVRMVGLQRAIADAIEGRGTFPAEDLGEEVAAT